MVIKTNTFTVLLYGELGSFSFVLLGRVSKTRQGEKIYSWRYQRYLRRRWKTEFDTFNHGHNISITFFLLKWKVTREVLNFCLSVGYDSRFLMPCLSNPMLTWAMNFYQNGIILNSNHRGRRNSCWRLHSRRICKDRQKNIGINCQIWFLHFWKTGKK